MFQFLRHIFCLTIICSVIAITRYIIVGNIVGPHGKNGIGCCTYHCDRINWIDDGEQQDMVGPVALVALTTQLIAGTLCNDLCKKKTKRKPPHTRLDRRHYWNTRVSTIWLSSQLHSNYVNDANAAANDTHTHTRARNTP